MAKINERSPEVELTEEAVDLLAGALDCEGIAAARVFGSQAGGRPGPLSDIDVGVWLEPEAERDPGLRARLLGRAVDALGTEEIDLVILNDASPLLRHRALTAQRLILDRDPKARVRLEARAIVEYLDTAPLRRELERGLANSLAEDSFGRS